MTNFDCVAFQRKVRTELSKRYQKDISLEKKELAKVRKKYHHLFEKDSVS